MDLDSTPKIESTFKSKELNKMLEEIHEKEGKWIKKSHELAIAKTVVKNISYF